MPTELLRDRLELRMPIAVDALQLHEVTADERQRLADIGVMHVHDVIDEARDLPVADVLAGVDRKWR